MSGLYLKYGTYQHSTDECSFVEERHSVRSPDGLRTETRIRWSIQGELRAASQAALTTAIDALLAAYSVEGCDVGFYLDDGSGTETAHVIRNANTVRGIRIVSPPSFPTGIGAEYSTWRTYTIVLEWEIADTVTGLVAWAQSISYEGTGGPDWGYLTPLVGPAQRQQFTQASVVRVVQAGRAQGNGAYPVYPGPLWPAQEHQPSRRREQLVPSFSSLEREVQWSYTFLFARSMLGTMAIPSA